MVKNYISAKDARIQTETTQKPLNVLFKLIKEDAEWGMSSIHHRVSDHDPKLVDDMIKALREAGYTVEEENDAEGKLMSLFISW